MGNIKNFNFNKLDLKLSNSDYWDFYLANDENEPDCEPLVNGSCNVVWYDFNEPSNYGLTYDSIYSLSTWDGATNNGYSLNTFGLTGIDNGRVLFEKGIDPTNPELLSALTGTTLVIPANDNRLNLYRVSGTTNQFTYETEIVPDVSVGNYLRLRGGFYQGFYKLDGEDYEVLPSRVNNSWSTEFWLKKEDLTTNNNILNILNPNNKGFFFYIGTRSENKFWNEWNGGNTGCTSACTADTGCTETVSTWCTIPKESDISIIGDYGVPIPLNPPLVNVELITNQFLIYGRAGDTSSPRLTGETGSFLYGIKETDVTETCDACGGSHDGLGTKSVCTYNGSGITVVRTSEIITNTNNPFLIYGRAGKNTETSGSTCSSCLGSGDGFGNEMVCSFSGITSPQTELDYNLDIIDNALGFRIKDDGSIGYRLLTVTGSCITNLDNTKSYVSGVTIEEKYSEAGLIQLNKWSYVVVKFVTDYKSVCDLKNDGPRKGKLKFYVDGNLKFVVNDFDEFIGRRLNEYKSKQIGVPFNISIGGGSQGLIETQTFDGLDPNDRNLPIQENFAGSFIGSISQFRFNICDLTLCKLRETYLRESPRYN